jgi:hypothetical protein
VTFAIFSFLPPSSEWDRKVPNSGAVSDEQVREVVRIAGDMNGGFVVQEEGASLVREKFPDVTRDRARRLVREITGNEKPGPKGPRRQKQLTTP